MHMTCITKETSVLHRYVNGDYTFTLHSDGTLIRETDADNPVAKFPSSMDVKITDWCDMGCAYCHESSTTKGKHSDLDRLLEVLDAAKLPPGIELAIGGGNPLAHPGLANFLVQLKQRGFVANLTANGGHVAQYQPLLAALIDAGYIHGLGISLVDSMDFDAVHSLYAKTKNIVFHVIAGVHPPVETLKALAQFKNAHILVLGYKEFGFGLKNLVKRGDIVYMGIEQWRQALPKLLGKYHLSFDNLAIGQLNVERCLTRDAWERYYMGDDFTFTMYIDAVRQQFAPTSRSIDRAGFDDVDLLGFFGYRDR